MQKHIDPRFLDLMYSDVAGTTWPKVPLRPSNAILGILFQIEQTQWWPSEQIVQRQLSQLHQLLQHAVRTAPYYQQILAKSVAAIRSPTIEQWREIPILTRAHLQTSGDALRSTAILESHGKTTTVRSSGSTGRPVTVHKTELSQTFWRTMTLRDHLWQRRDLTGKLAVIRHSSNPQSEFPHGVKQDNWGTASSAIFRNGPCIILRSATNIADQAQWLLREQPNYLLTYPSILHELARHFIAHKMKLASLRSASTFGEALGDGVRIACREAWGVSLSDFYSAEETGYIALQCPENEHYHVPAEDTLVEILDDNNQPCAPGEIGRVIVTPLHNFAMPLIRYEIGDFAEVGEPCPCGRGLPVLKRIIGRIRNLVRLPDGNRFRPAVGIRDFEKIAPIQQAQLIQHSLDEVEAKIVVPHSLSPEQEAKLINVVQVQLRHRFRVTISYHNQLARSSRDKFEDFISKVSDDSSHS